MNQEKFDRDLARLKKLNPSHEILPVIEERGCDHLSWEYLQMALQDPVPQIDPKIAANDLFKQKQSLYSKRAQLSNKLHDCGSNQERKEVSIAIGSIQTQIIENRRLIEEYYATGTVPKAPAKMVMPLDGRRKEKKLHSKRSSRSRFKKMLSTEKNPDKIKKYESRIAECDRIIGELSA